MGEVAPEEKIAVLLRYAEYLQRVSGQEKAIECCEKAMKLLDEKCVKKEYLRSKIFQRLENIYDVLHKKCSEEFLNTIRSSCNYYLIAETESWGKTLEEQCSLWADAAHGYGMMKNVEKETACWEHFAELIERVEEFNKKFYRFYLVTGLGFWKNYLKQAGLEKTKALMSNVYSKVLLYLQREGNEEEKSGFEFELWNIACTFTDYDVSLEEAVVFYMLSVYVTVVNQPDWNVMLSVADNMKKVPEEILDAIREALQGTPTSEQILCLDMIGFGSSYILEKKEGFEEVREIIELYVKRFYDKEWEFKGEE